MKAASSERKLWKEGESPPPPSHSLSVTQLKKMKFLNHIGELGNEIKESLSLLCPNMPGRRNLPLPLPLNPNTQIKRHFLRTFFKDFLPTFPFSVPETKSKERSRRNWKTKMRDKGSGKCWKGQDRNGTEG